MTWTIQSKAYLNSPMLAFINLTKSNNQNIIVRTKEAKYFPIGEIIYQTQIIRKAILLFHYSTITGINFLYFIRFRIKKKIMTNKIPTSASAVSIYLLPNLSCVHPLKVVIYTTGKLPKDASKEYLVATFLLPITKKIIAVNAA